MSVEESSAPASEGDNSEPALSKTQLKKKLKHEKWIESRPERRRLERERRKKRRKAEASNEESEGPKLLRKTKLMADSSNKFRIVIDMDFNDQMTDSEIRKACQQISRIYAMNRHSEEPCQLYFTSLKGKIQERFQKMNLGYKKWDVNTSELDFTELFADAGDRDADAKSQNNFVYLTADSEDTLSDTETLLSDESKIYIIGGLVDHNRHKNLCYNRAVERNIPTAKLPISDHLVLCQSGILSTVAVFDTLLRIFADHNTWPEALASAIPARKIAKPDGDKTNRRKKNKRKRRSRKNSEEDS